MKIKHVIAALALGQMVMVGQASAACVAGNIAGTWYSHMAFWNSVDGTRSDGWLRCKLVVNSSGGVSATSKCVDETGAAHVATGTLKVSAACGVTGTLTVSHNGIVDGRAALRYVQMDLSHNSFSGLGVVSTESEVKFSVSAVKQ